MKYFWAILFSIAVSVFTLHRTVIDAEEDVKEKFVCWHNQAVTECPEIHQIYKEINIVMIQKPLIADDENCWVNCVINGLGKAEELVWQGSSFISKWNIYIHKDKSEVNNIAEKCHAECAQQFHNY